MFAAIGSTTLLNVSVAILVVVAEAWSIQLPRVPKPEGIYRQWQQPRSGYSKVKSLMHLLRFIRARCNIALEAVYLPGKDNTLTDAISGDNSAVVFIGPSGSVLSNVNSTSPANTSGGQQTGLVLPSLGPVVRQLFSSGIANSTVWSYRTGCNRYVQFFVSAASKVGSCYFAYLFEEHLTSRTIRVYVAALRYTQIALGLGDPYLYLSCLNWMCDERMS